MSQITIKDRHFRIVGYIDTRPDGVKVVKDAKYKDSGLLRAKK